MKPDGGPAFPYAYDVPISESAPIDTVRCIKTNDGMSLRDYFAAAAMTGLLAARNDSMLNAERSYEHADAMLEARLK